MLCHKHPFSNPSLEITPTPMNQQTALKQWLTKTHIPRTNQSKKNTVQSLEHARSKPLVGAHSFKFAVKRSQSFCVNFMVNITWHKQSKECSCAIFLTLLSEGTLQLITIALFETKFKLIPFSSKRWCHSSGSRTQFSEGEVGAKSGSEEKSRRWEQKKTATTANRPKTTSKTDRKESERPQPNKPRPPFFPRVLVFLPPTARNTQLQSALWPLRNVRN